MLSAHPIAVEFDLELNAPSTLETVAYSSKDKYWWRCTLNRNHIWYANVNNRTKKNRPAGCGLCRGNRVTGDQIPFERSLAGRYPDVARDLNEERSGLAARHVLSGSRQVAWWRCPRGHEDYDMPINSRTNLNKPQGCPYCAGKRISPERTLTHVAPVTAAEFLESVNGIAADQVFSQSNAIFVWQCAADSSHRWAATPNNRVGKGSGCPFCTGARVWDLNRLSMLRPDLIGQWDLERNGTLTPHDVSVGSSIRVHWKCPAGPDHRWVTSVQKRSSGQGCPACSGNQVSITNSLLTGRPDLAAQLDARRSGVSAAELTVNSNRKVWWICPIDPEHTWDAVVNNRANGTGCRDCNTPGTSAQEIRLAAELSTVLPLSPGLHGIRTAQRAERVDMVFKTIKLIVEFDGSYWHEATIEADTTKSQRLRDGGWTVVRVREAPLGVIDRTFDVVVPHRAPVEVASSLVLHHLAGLGLCSPGAAADYQRTGTPQAGELAQQWLEAARHAASQREPRD
jgi:hypothetical protein